MSSHGINMANEAVVLSLVNGGEVVNFTVADGATIEKGTLCQLTDPVTASASSGAGQEWAGIAATEKIASDGRTTLGLWTKGLFDLRTAGGVVGIGDPVALSGANLIRLATAADISGGMVIGKALEAAARGTAETISVFVGGF